MVCINRPLTKGPHVSTPRSLYLCRTPFQLLMCQRIVALFPDETADLCYMTDQDTSKDTSYVARASGDFERTEYRVLRSRFDILPFVRSLRRHWLGTSDYQKIYVANHTLSHFRYLLKSHRSAEVRSFDEGSGNFDWDGALHVDKRTTSERLRDTVLGIPAIQTIFSKSQKHYTVNASLRNVVAAERLEQIDLIQVPQAGASTNGWVNVVIGQPFEQFLGTTAQSKLLSAYSRIEAGRYVVHPRETDRSEILPNLRVIREERILEDYVCDLAASGKRVRLMGPFSTAFFTINSPVVEKFYLHVSTSDTHSGLATAAGCEVINLHDEIDVERWKSITETWRNDGAQDASRAG